MASVSQCQNKFFIEFHTGVRSISHPPLTPESAQEKTDLLAIIMIFFLLLPICYQKFISRLNLSSNWIFIHRFSPFLRPEGTEKKNVRNLIEILIK